MRVSRALLLLALAGPAAAAGGDAFVLAWPPTRYESAELVLWRQEAAATPLVVRVTGRGIDALVELPASGAARLPLPPSARCGVGLDACALRAAREAGSGPFHALLQSPDTHGAADTLLLTAHDTVLAMPAAAAGTRWTALSLPCAPPAEMPMTASFVTIVPVQGPARVQGTATACTAAFDEAIADGEALTLACHGAGEDLSGMSVEADTPIVVLSGNAVTTSPVDPGRGLSGDLVMDLAAWPSGPARLAVPPLPRGAVFSGQGDVVRVVALEAARVRVQDDRGGARDLVLAAGEVVDLDTAATGGDLALSLIADASIAAWHVPRSRALRGIGDAAAIPVVPSARFTLHARFFVPEGYAEANVLMVAAEPGARVTLDGIPLDLVPDPSGALDMGRVDLPPAPSGGAVRELAGDAPFGAWVAGFGGYKAYGHAAAERAPARANLLRGTRPDALAPLVPADTGAHEDPDPSPRLFWRVEDPGATLHARRCGAATCLQW